MEVVAAAIGEDVAPPVMAHRLQRIAVRRSTSGAAPRSDGRDLAIHEEPRSHPALPAPARRRPLVLHVGERASRQPRHMGERVGHRVAALHRCQEQVRLPPQREAARGRSSACVEWSSTRRGKWGRWTARSRPLSGASIAARRAAWRGSTPNRNRSAPATRHRIRPRDRQAGVASPTGCLGAGAGAGVAWVPGVSQAAIVIRAHSDRDGDMDGSLDARVVRGRRDDAITPRWEPGARRCGDSPTRPEPGARVRGSLGRARHPGGCGDRAQHSEAVISSPRRAGTPR